MKILKSKINLLMLADVFFPDTIGGAGRVLYHLSLELSRKGHEVHIITRKTGRNLQSHQKLNTNLFVHRFPTTYGDSPGFLLSEIKNSFFLVKKLARRIAFDMVCVHQSLVAIGPILSRCLQRIPIVYYFHSPWHEEFLIKRQKDNIRAGKKAIAVAFIMRWIEKLIMSNAAKVIVMSQYTFNKVLEIHHYPKKKIKKIPGGVDLNRFSLPAGRKIAAKGAAELPLDKIIFLTVRNLVPRMGIENLIEAFNRSNTLRQKGLLLIGGKGFLEDRLRAIVKEYNLQGSIHFLGHIPEENLTQIYQAADFFVLPTRKLEGFGLVILEAMASGTPVLGTPVGAIPELIGSFDRILICDGPGWRDLKGKMEEVLENPERFKFDPEICRKFVEENFSWERMADLFEQEVTAKTILAD